MRWGERQKANKFQGELFFKVVNVSQFCIFYAIFSWLLIYVRTYKPFKLQSFPIDEQKRLALEK
jgi:hypothetical protein